MDFRHVVLAWQLVAMGFALGCQLNASTLAADANPSPSTVLLRVDSIIAVGRVGRFGDKLIVNTSVEDPFAQTGYLVGPNGEPPIEVANMSLGMFGSKLIGLDVRGPILGPAIPDSIDFATGRYSRQLAIVDGDRSVLVGLQHGPLVRIDLAGKVVEEVPQHANIRRRDHRSPSSARHRATDRSGSVAAWSCSRPRLGERSTAVPANPRGDHRVH